MYSRQLESFIRVAELGSFSKASEALNITPTSLIQQINLLEDRLGLCLFHRSPRGVALTAAGSSIYEDAVNIIHLSKLAVERARALESGRQNTVRVGTSLFTKCRMLMDIWARASQDHPQLRIELVGQDSISAMTADPLSGLGLGYDMQEGIYIDGLYESKCNFLALSQVALCVSVPAGHRLYDRQRLSLEDLAGETLVLTKKGQTPAFDSVRGSLETEGINTAFVEMDFYDINVYATCEMRQWLLLSLDVWQDIYPSMHTIPLDVGFTVPYGLVYPLKPSPAVQILVDTATRMYPVVQ